ncbi:MAG: hypothetical protein QNK16_11490 [Woeseiaceae bacterium]|nr:hypothetical protein [Woeseiaceae bacterium]MDX2608999.1 hypothetical protein [Woeseiaceae bacterium]
MGLQDRFIVGLVLCVLVSACATSREAIVGKNCKYIRPDMTLADANELIGWEPENTDGSWYWTDRKRCVVHIGDGKIVEVLDFVRFKHYHKLVGEPGVYERDIETEGTGGDPINQW